MFNQEDLIQRVVEVIKNLGVCSAQDLQYMEADDLSGALKQIEIRKVMTCIKTVQNRKEKRPFNPAEGFLRIQGKKKRRFPIDRVI